MTIAFFDDQKARANPGSFDPRVSSTGIGLPPNIAKLAREFGATDTEEFAAYCSVYARDVAARLLWHESDVNRATAQLYTLLGKPGPTEPPQFALGARVPPKFVSRTAQELAAEK